MSKINLDNVEKALTVMRRVDAKGYNFDLGTFQDVPHSANREEVFTEKTAHKCGTAACFSGWINLSPEWRSQPNIHRRSIGACYKEKNGMEGDECEAMAQWLGIEYEEASAMIYNGKYNDKYVYGGKDMSDITVCDVINHLEKIKARGLAQNGQ
jgi:hypothetical protein